MAGGVARVAIGMTDTSSLVADAYAVVAGRLGTGAADAGMFRLSAGTTYAGRTDGPCTSVAGSGNTGIAGTNTGACISGAVVA